MCFDAKKWWEEHKIEKQDAYLKVLWVKGSTHRSKKGIWGKYRKMRNAYCADGISSIDSLKIQDTYTDLLGLTTFDSTMKVPEAAIWEAYPKGTTITEKEMREKYWNSTSDEYLKQKWIGY